MPPIWAKRTPGKQPSKQTNQPVLEPVLSCEPLLQFFLFFLKPVLRATPKQHPPLNIRFLRAPSGRLRRGSPARVEASAGWARLHVAGLPRAGGGAQCASAERRPQVSSAKTLPKRAALWLLNIQQPKNNGPCLPFLSETTRRNQAREKGSSSHVHPISPVEFSLLRCLD